MADMNVMLDAVCLAARLMLESGSETYRAEETVEHMCKGFGIQKADVLALPTGLILTLSEKEGDAAHTRLIRVRSRNTNLSRMDACNAVSRQVARGQLTPEEALKKLQDIQHTPLPRFLWQVLFGALSAAFFCIMLGGMAEDFIVALLCGLLIHLVMPLLGRWHVPGMLGGLFTGFLTAQLALICNTLYPIHLEPAISGAVLPLLSGLATTNAIRDTIKGDLVSGSARISEAVLTAVFLAAGICIALSMWGGKY
ncbi:MAG: threonine/serine exporter family protein [Clostridia bacterium]|nr:threonine/serine exporter family protein [Clostridia bacterium]